MAQLSLTEVSKRFKVNRTTIYRAVNNGKLSRLNNGLFDLAEVIRVFGEAQTAEAAPVANKESSEQSKLVEGSCWGFPQTPRNTHEAINYSVLFFFTAL